MIVEFVIIQLIYVPGRRRRIMLTRKKSEPSGSVAVVADWYFKTLVKERSMLRPGTKERYREWKIYTGDKSLFTVDGIIKEPEHIRKNGSAPLTCSYCGCCVYSHIPTIIETVKECIKLNVPEENYSVVQLNVLDKKHSGDQLKASDKKPIYDQVDGSDKKRNDDQVNIPDENSCDDEPNDQYDNHIKQKQSEILLN